ncbi:Cox family DNA-binding protein [Serratia marcescens]
MNEQLLRALFAIPDAITADEFARRTGKSEPSVRKLIERRQLPLATEKEVIGEGGSSFRLFILWNQWLEMVYDATGKLPPERRDWRDQWIKKANKLAQDLGLGFMEFTE